MKSLAVAFLALFCALAESKNIEPFKRIPQRIVGGTQTTIQQYPYGAAMLYNQGWSSVYDQNCGGSILTSRYILSAAHCYINAYGVTHTPSWWRVRVGSSTSNAGGVVHNIQTILNHPNYSMTTYNSDVAVLRTATVITYSATVAACSIAGTNYIVPDNAPVWAIGWGSTVFGGPFSTNLRHVQVWTVNQNVCNTRYGGLITQNMLCSGWLDVGGRDQCSGDSGGPLVHNGVVVGICSFGNGCANPYFPGVNTRVSMFTTWILANAQ